MNKCKDKNIPVRIVSVASFAAMSGAQCACASVSINQRQLSVEEQIALYEALNKDVFYKHP